MPFNESRQHFRVEDNIYFDYRIIEPESFMSDESIRQELMGEANQRFLEASEYFDGINQELNELTQHIAISEPSVAHFMNLLNSKIDFLRGQLMIGDQIQKHSVNLSLGGVAFRSEKKLPVKTRAKLLIYTKPRLIPVVVNAFSISCVPIPQDKYRISMQFETLNTDQEELLSQHIMLAQVRFRVDS